MFSSELLSLASLVLNQAKTNGATLALAESCTGGLISALLTEIPGSSTILQEGFVTYSNDAKHHTLEVTPLLTEQYGAVSKEVALAMAEGAMIRSGASVSLAVTGIAGPSGGTTDKPVGTVFIAYTSHITTPIVQHHLFKGDRSTIRLATVRAALNLLLKQLSS